MKTLSNIADLEAVYGQPVDRALWKEIDHINDHYQSFIEQSSFLVLATYGPKGIDCSPRGDPPGFVRVLSKTCIQIPDRRGNNRIDSLRNIIINPKVGIIFLVPGVGETIRLRGKAQILVDPKLCESFSMNGKPASSVLSIDVTAVLFQCQKAIARSQLWHSEKHTDKRSLPTAGEMTRVFADAHNIEFDAESYDKNYPENMKKTIY